MNAYDPAGIESRWQTAWANAEAFRAKNPGDPDFDAEAPKYYVLDMFPYPSGSGLHVGHAVGYVGTDVVARRKRMQGHNVLHPMGWDAFGLPAEQYAILTGKHPKDTTAENTATFRRQLQAIGLSYDWSREINTSDPKYFRWTQWIFKRLFERGLAYQTEMPVWWCEELKTVLSNEEVINGRSERGNYPCVRRPLKQWMLKITAYADRLLADLEDLDWPESVKTMQREWIGRSDGAEVTFPIEGLEDSLTVFTTRPDTLWGASFMVIAPEHPLLEAITCESDREAVQAYVAEAAAKSERERTDDSKEKTGVFTGRYARNPVVDEDDDLARIPIFVADYVLATYGTGAIMAVPGHDERDFEFAKRYNLTVRRVVAPPEGTEVDEDSCYSGRGTAMHSGPLDGLPTKEAIGKAIAVLKERELGSAKTSYRLRDWLFSRQRYWGEPFPLVHTEDGRTLAVADEELPVELPQMDDFTPAEDGSPPLARAVDWLKTTAADGDTPAQRDTDTMPGWAGSCWYWLRFMDPENGEAPYAKEAEAYWGPVDLYVGGAAHAVLHLLYARFWHKVLYDEGLVSTKEPFQRLFNQGMLTAFAYQDASGRLVPTDEVDSTGDGFVRKESGEAVEQIVTKMAKSLKNVVNPDDIIAEYGADTLRLYELFMGPLGDSKPWNPRDIAGCRRFLDRVWRLYVDVDAEGPVRPALQADGASSEALERAFHQALAKVDAAFEHFNLNTAVAAMMSFVNEATKAPKDFGRDLATRFLAMLSPFASHAAEELWLRMGHDGLACQAAWPILDPEQLVEDTFELVVQVNGKLRATVAAPKEAAKDELEALARDAAAAQLADKQERRVIVVPGKLVNFVVS